ncbi:hypothetical protein [Erwinia sp. CGal63]|uniref:hypothetical protein n=1 Tax=Erwinia sp. CGal63 TaxID=2919889 RepID=UPI003007F51D
MRRVGITFVFSLLFLLAGYFSWHKVTQFYLGDAMGNITNMRMYLIAPLLCAVLWLMIFLIAKKIFNQITLLPVGKESGFCLSFLAGNLAFLFLISKLAYFMRSDELKSVQLDTINILPLALIYLASALLSVTLFAILRRKCR